MAANKPSSFCVTLWIISKFSRVFRFFSSKLKHTSFAAKHPHTQKTKQIRYESELAPEGSGTYCEMKIECEKFDLIGIRHCQQVSAVCVYLYIYVYIMCVFAQVSTLRFSFHFSCFPKWNKYIDFKF